MIVCEVGLNHLGNEEYSTMYMEKLSKSKCDAISYQIREPKFYAKDKYKDYELSFDHYQGLIKSTDKKFGVALADEGYLEMLNDLNQPFEEIDIEKENISREKLREITGGSTVPQIIINNKSIFSNPYIKENMSIFIELFFYKKILHNKNNLKFYNLHSLILTKLNLLKKFNLDFESFLLDFSNIAINE